MEPLLSTKHAELFHYTSLAALKGMLETKTLWATHAEHMNDSSEMKLGWPILEKSCIGYLEDAINEYYEQAPDSMQEIEAHGGAPQLAAVDGNMVVSVMRSLLFGNNKEPGMGIPFVASFATHEDDYHRHNGMLSQWRGYGRSNNETIAIVFQTEQLENLLKTECRLFSYLSCSIAEVVYYRGDMCLQSHFCRLFNVLRGFSRHVVKGLDVDTDEVQRNLSRLGAEILPAVGRLKHRAFHEEQECRVIVGVPHEFHSEKFDQLGGPTKQFKKIHFRPGLVGSIPYIQLFEDLQHHLPIKRIVVGPSRNQLANLETVHRLLKLNERSTVVSVQRSEIPYVGSV